MYVEDVEDSIINFGVYSTVYTIDVEDIEDIQMYMYLFQENDPDKHKSWFEADEEVAWIYEDAKQCHRKIMTSELK